MLPAELFEACEAFVEDIEGGAVAEADALVVAEGDAGDGGDLVAGEQLVAEVHGLEAHLAGVNEKVIGDQAAVVAEGAAEAIAATPGEADVAAAVAAAVETDCL